MGKKVVGSRCSGSGVGVGGGGVGGGGNSSHQSSTNSNKKPQHQHPQRNAQRAPSNKPSSFQQKQQQQQQQQRGQHANHHHPQHPQTASNTKDGNNNNNIESNKRRALVEQAVEEMDMEANASRSRTRSSSSSKRFKKGTTTATVQPSLGVVLSVYETCSLMADLSEAILENPQGAFQQEELLDDEESNNDTPQQHNDNNNEGSRGQHHGRKTFSKMGRLLAIANTSLSSTSSSQSSRLVLSPLQQADQEHMVHLAILSLLVIFKDILPAYRIRLPSPQEMAIKVSKDTKQVWDYERALLQHYQQFLQLLEATWKAKEKESSSSSSSSTAAAVPSKCAVTAILSLADLLKSAFHFNFCSNLLTIVVQSMNHANETVRKACCSAIAHVFVQDAQGDVALEATRRVTKMIIKRNFKVRPIVLQTLIKLPLRVHVDEAQAAKLTAKANAKKRKKNKELASIEAELKEGQATVDKIVLARSQADALQAVTLTYFRILKHTERDLSSNLQTLLPATLEGLAKFAHLINIDTVMDLLKVLKTLLLQVDALPLEASLHAVLTAFFALHGPGKEMNIDVKEYIVPLYTQVSRIAHSQPVSTTREDATSSSSTATEITETTTEATTKNTELLLQCLRVAFFQRREFSNVRVAAFLKQIVTAAMHTSSTAPATCMALLAFARQVLQRYPTATMSLLENEHDVVASGTYNGNVVTCPDPELCNPLTTSAWELSLLQFHVNPQISRQARHAASSTLSQVPLLETPERFLSTWRDHENGQDLHIPFIRSNKKHPLAVKESSGNNKKNKKHQPRFITPRVQECFLIKDPSEIKNSNK